MTGFCGIDDDVDLSKAELFYDSRRGVFIPQNFAEDIIRESLQGVTDETLDSLLLGPESEFYWDDWVSVLDNAYIMRDGIRWVFYQDGDLWFLPEQKEVN